MHAYIAIIMYSVVIIICNHILNKTGVLDSSGLEYFYSNTKPVHEAGLLTIGHNVRPSMVIPPSTDNYLIEGLCSGQCTKQVTNWKQFMRENFVIRYLYILL